MSGKIRSIGIIVFLLLILPFGVCAQDVLTGEQIKGMTVAQVAKAYAIDSAEFIRALSSQSGIRGITRETQFSLLHDNYGLTSNKVKIIAEAVREGKAGALPVQKVAFQKKGYSLPGISGVLLLAYLISLFLVKKGVLSLVTQRRLWNSAMGIFFTGTATLGLILVLRISYGVNIELPMNILYWHVQAGIAFSAIALFHILWHATYFRAFFPKKK